MLDIYSHKEKILLLDLLIVKDNIKYFPLNHDLNDRLINNYIEEKYSPSPSLKHNHKTDFQLEKVLNTIRIYNIPNRILSHIHSTIVNKFMKWLDRRENQVEAEYYNLMPSQFKSTSPIPTFLLLFQRKERKDLYCLFIKIYMKRVLRGLIRRFKVTNQVSTFKIKNYIENIHIIYTS